MDPVSDRHNHASSDVSSNNSDRVDAELVNYEKTQLGQAPLPFAPTPIPAVPVTEKGFKSKDKRDSSDHETEDPFAHLPEHEKAILKRQLDMPTINVTYKMLFRYATRNDKLIMALSAFCAIAGGALLPLMTIVFGGLTSTFQDWFQHTISQSHFNSVLSRFSLYFLYLAIGEYVFVYIATAGFLYTGEHISGKIREHFLQAILSQNIAFFDQLGAGEITTRITSDTNSVQDGISEKIGLTLTAIATFVTAFVVSFIKYWRLTLILTSTVVAIVVTMGAMSGFIVKFNKASLASYAEGGTVAEEVISSVRNAKAFNTEEKLARQYDTHLAVAEGWGFKMKAATGSMIGFLMSVYNLTVLILRFTDFVQVLCLPELLPGLLDGI
jgi:ATP-binding cassette subfamily B (MDR/TAP) protein 1